MGIDRTTVSRALVATAAAIGVIGLMLVTPAQAATTTSSLRSVHDKTCLDVSTTGGNFLDTYGLPCNGSGSQTYTFAPVSGAPAHTYTVTSQLNGQCLISYRFGVRQGGCSLSTAQWTFVQLGTSTHRYHMEPTYTVADPIAQCIHVQPKPPGYPGDLWTHTTCSSAKDQVIAVPLAL